MSNFIREYYGKNVYGNFTYSNLDCVFSIVIVFRRDSPPTRSRRSTGSGGESSSMLTSVEENAVQAFSKENNCLPHCVALCWRFSLDDNNNNYDVTDNIIQYNSKIIN
jgi:hypothetical protein